MSTINCSNCGKPLECQSEDVTNCWCASYPMILPVSDDKGCLCSSCLKEKIQSTIQGIVQDIKLGKRKNDVPKIGGKLTHLVEGIDYYIENGLWVFTEWYHLKKNYCCGNDCRHCPYKKVG